MCHAGGIVRWLNLYRDYRVIDGGSSVLSPHFSPTSSRFEPKTFDLVFIDGALDEGQ